jgi:hypothetical protein
MSKSRAQEVTRLLHDPLFAEFDYLHTSPSFFNIVGRTFTETWHSAMLGWLLNPQSSHGIGDYALKRFIMLLASGEGLEWKHSPDSLLIDGDFSQAEARPNEYSPSEVSIRKIASSKNEGGRIDVFIDGIRQARKDVTILVEMKVNAQINAEQNRKYLAWANDKEKQWGQVVFLVYVTPEWNYYSEAYNELNESKRWIIVNFQQLYDEVYLPALSNPRLSNFGRVMLEEYIKILKQPNPQKGNQRMAITLEERLLAEKIQEKYGPSIDALIAILRPTELADITTSNSKKSMLQVTLNNKQEFRATSIPKLYEQVLKYLVDHQMLDDLELPYAPRRSAILLATNKFLKEDSERDFVKPVEVGNYVMEANKSRENGLAMLELLLKELNLGPDIKNIEGK